MFRTHGPKTSYRFIVSFQVDDNHSIPPDKLREHLMEGLWHLAGVGNIIIGEDISQLAAEAVTKE